MVPFLVLFSPPLRTRRRIAGEEMMDIIPCPPLRGGKAFIVQTKVAVKVLQKGEKPDYCLKNSYFVRCENKCAKTELFPFASDAVTVWNRKVCR